MSDYTVGYGRPPKDTRFPDGESGNPKGRPPIDRGALDPSSVLNAERKVRINGKRKTMSSGELRLRKQVKLALEKKNVSAILYLIDQFEKYGLLAGVVQHRQSNVVLIPTDIPDGMVRLLQDQYGWPPYTSKERAWAKRVYLEQRTEEEREEDEFIGYFDDG